MDLTHMQVPILKSTNKKIRILSANEIPDCGWYRVSVDEVNDTGNQLS